MVNAILSGAKTQTRRLVKPQPAFGLDGFSGFAHNVRGAVWRSGLPTVNLRQHGSPGTRLWVRETFAAESRSRIAYRADVAAGDWPGSAWKPSIHMPRWASRITLEITEVRVERLQEISEDDARSEGVSLNAPESAPWVTGGKHLSHRSAFFALWDSINENRATWKSNPFVWVIRFRRLESAREAAE